MEVIEDMIQVPLTLYNVFQIQESFGFNRMTFKLWLKDHIIGKLMSVVFGIPLIWSLLWIISTTGSYFVLYIGIFLTIFVFLLMVIAPICIMPAFNNFDKIEDNKLREDIEKLATELKYPLTKIEIVDGSKKSGHSNAYQYGFGKIKKIVIYDTLLE